MNRNTKNDPSSGYGSLMMWFFVWTHDEKSLKHFIDFCNDYASSSNMKSSIRFTSEYSNSSVSFLDMNVRIENGHICTSVYSKPVDTHTYLHSTSFHSPSTIISLPKIQFIRIRRLCTSTADYKHHATKFIEFFTQRGFKRNKLGQSANELAKMSREDLLAIKPVKRSSDHPKCTVYTVTWHPVSGPATFTARYIQKIHNAISTTQGHLS